MLARKGLASLFLSVLISGACVAQVKPSDPGKILTRISYRTTYGIDWREQKGSPQICFALYRNGYYRLSRMTDSGPQGLQGTLSADQVSRLGEMLRDLSAQHREDGLVLRGSESLVVEMATNGKRYAWVDADHRSPFPVPVAQVVRWLQEFKAQDETPLTLRELSDQPICPPASEKRLQPAVAKLNGGSDEAASCGKMP